MATAWSNNDNKNDTSWSLKSKVKAIWNNNINKNKTTYTATTKNDSSWNINYQTPQPYIYDSGAITYDSAFYEYDFIAKNNQLNQKNVTNWSVSEQ